MSENSPHLIAPLGWDQLKDRLPDETLRVWPEVGTRDDLEAALIWRVVPGLFEGRERLSFVSATGAGVDHLLCEPSLPKEVPVTRITDQDFAGLMTDFAIGCYCEDATRCHRTLLAELLAEAGAAVRAPERAG